MCMRKVTYIMCDGGVCYTRYFSANDLSTTGPEANIEIQPQLINNYYNYCIIIIRALHKSADAVVERR